METMTFNSCIKALQELRGSLKVATVYSRGVYDGLMFAEVLLKLKREFSENGEC